MTNISGQIFIYIYLPAFFPLTSKEPKLSKGDGQMNDGSSFFDKALWYCQKKGVECNNKVDRPILPL